ncbi:MAG: DMT family transporter, partial [Gammaproteobacteria bacterium]|nr:DMT family transporter [Gammaproteobacteria bacterium]
MENYKETALDENGNLVNGRGNTSWNSAHASRGCSTASSGVGRMEKSPMISMDKNTDRPALGIVLMIAGVAGLALMDATIKWLTTDYPVTQIVALRSWFGLPLLCLLAFFEGGVKALKTSRPFVHVGRYCLVLALSFGFFWSLSQMKLVDTIAITFAAPILITALSVLLLREPVGLHRWLAVGAGFFGVVIMLRPGSGLFQWTALVVLGSVVMYALLMISTRALKSTES